MEHKILIVSHLAEDLEFGVKIAANCAAKIEAAVTANDIRKFLSTHSRAAVLWNADNFSLYERAHEVFPKYSSPRRIFAITQKPMYQFPELFTYQIFGHHLLRRYEPPATLLYSKLIASVLDPKSAGIHSFFPTATDIKKIPVANSAHKRAATEAIQKHLTNQGVVGRLAVIVAQAMDELIMNAIFDAPTDKAGERYRWKEDRNAEFELKDKEQVSVMMSSTDDYMGFGVVDKFGSLRRSTLLELLGKHYRQIRSHDAVPAVGMGLRGILEAGLSIDFIVNPGVETQVLLIFKKCSSFREFRGSMQFLSINGD